MSWAQRQSAVARLPIGHFSTACLDFAVQAHILEWQWGVNAVIAS